MRCSVWAGLLLTLAVLGGCGGQDGEPQKKPPLTAAEEKEVKALLEVLGRQVQISKEVVAILKSVGNRSSMDRALQEVIKPNQQNEAAVRDFNHLLATASRAVQECVEQDPVLAELRELQQAMVSEMVRIEKLPDGKEFLSAWKSLTKPKTP